jgi:hypothetical protein
MLRHPISKGAILAATLFASPALAQQWQCFSGAVACAPGSPNCTCTQVQPPPPVAAPPTCPVMTYWNGVTCVVPAPTFAPTFVPPYYNPYTGYEHWDHPHPH